MTNSVTTCPMGPSVSHAKATKAMAASTSRIDPSTSKNPPADERLTEREALSRPSRRHATLTLQKSAGHVRVGDPVLEPS